MKPIGPIIKKYIEERKMVKGEVAKKVGITYNYLSTIFQKDTLDAAMLERLCVATGLHPMTFFECGKEGETVSYSDIKAKANIGNAEVKIHHNSTDYDRALADKERIIEEKNRLIEEKDKLLLEKDKRIEEKNRLIEEKERTIQILMRQLRLQDGTDSRQDN